MVASNSDPVIPQETPPAKVNGEIIYPCCGQLWSIRGENISNVACPKCQKLYAVAIITYIIPSQTVTFVKGTVVWVKEPYVVRVGATERKILPGKYKVTQDAYNLVGNLLDHTLIEISAPTHKQKDRTLAAMVPNDILEEAKEDAVRSGL